jgi:DNA-directed RNA polymerases I, II, and III subunit RPABC5
MIIPVKCFTCGKVLANKYEYFKEQVRIKKTEQKQNENNVIYLTKAFAEKTAEGLVMDKLNLTKMCCRRHMLTHVDIE